RAGGRPDGFAAANAAGEEELLDCYLAAALPVEAAVGNPMPALAEHLFDDEAPAGERCAGRKRVACNARGAERQAAAHAAGVRLLILAATDGACGHRLLPPARALQHLVRDPLQWLGPVGTDGARASAQRNCLTALGGDLPLPGQL